MTRLTPTAVKLLAELGNDSLAAVLNLAKWGFTSKEAQRRYPDRLVYTKAQAQTLRRQKDQARRRIARRVTLGAAGKGR